MKTETKQLSIMLGAGAIAGFLSGLMFPLNAGPRGAAFGIGLSLTAWLIRNKYPKWTALIPGLALGSFLFFLPSQALKELGEKAISYDPLNALNAAIFMPLFAVSYLSDSWKKRIFKMLGVGLLSSILRTLAFDLSWDAVILVLFTFPIGMFPFLILWLIAMRLTDPALKPTRERGGT